MSPQPGPKRPALDTESPLAPGEEPDEMEEMLGPAGPNMAFTYGKWGAVGISATSFLIAVLANSSAGSAAQDLETAAAVARQPDGRPAAIFNPQLQALENDGRSAASRAMLFTIIGAASAGAAAALFYLDLQQVPLNPADVAMRPRRATVRAAPAIGPGFYGFSGEVQF